MDEPRSRGYTPGKGMRASLLLALTVMSALPVRGEEEARPPGSQAAAVEPHQAAPQLLYMERALMEKQEARDSGQLPPEKYREFIASFRMELDAVMDRIPPTPENKGLHAQILARLGPQEQAQALASLDAAQAQDPENPALLVARGSILYEQRDFQAADALALQGWEASGRKDARAWALHKMSEGRISGVQSGEPAPRLKPASDFERLDWSIPERHDINEQGLDHLRNATKAFRAGDTAAARMYTQAAMNADPTSKSMQDLYKHAQANFARRDEIMTYLDQAVTAKNAGRHQDALVWMQKAYDAFPNDKAYEALQTARQRAAADAARRAAEQPKKASKGTSPLLPILAIFGTGLAGYGVYQVAKSKSARTSDDGINPSPQVAPDQARRNYLASAAVAGAALAALATWEFGPGAVAAVRAVLAASGPSAGAAEAMTPALAGAGSAGGSGALISQPAAVGAAKAGLATAGAYVGARAISENVSYSQSQQSGGAPPSSNPTEGPSSSIKKPSAKDPQLQRAIDRLFQETDRLPGGTAGAVRNEARTGLPTGNKFHTMKAQQNITNLEKILRRTNLDPVDRATAEALVADLKSALQAGVKP